MFSVFSIHFQSDFGVLAGVDVKIAVYRRSFNKSRKSEILSCLSGGRVVVITLLITTHLHTVTALTFQSSHYEQNHHSQQHHLNHK